MNRSFFLLVLYLTHSLLFTQKQLTVEDIFGKSELQPETWLVRSWRPKHSQYTYYRNRENETPRHGIYYTEAQSGQTYLLTDSESLPVLDSPRIENRFILPNYQWTPDGESLLIPSDRDLYLYNPAVNEAERLTHDNPVENNPLFSPDGKWIACIKENNLTLINVNTHEVTILTRHGNEKRLVGQFDWAYEEEFKIRQGFVWSPDSRHIAFFEFDISKEPVYEIKFNLDDDYAMRKQPYPHPGEAIAKVRIGVIDIRSHQITWLQTGKNRNIYIPRIHWLPDSHHLAMQRLNRRQDRLDLLISDISTGRSRTLLTETDPEGWVDILDDPIFYRENSFLWLSERDDWTHIYNVDAFHEIRQITHGDWNVTELVHADPRSGWIYFMATEKSRIERHLYRIHFDGTGFQRLTRRDGEHRIEMSTDGKFYVDTFSNVTTPPQVTLHLADGELIAILSSGEIPALQHYRLTQPEFMTVTTSDGLNLDAQLMTPVDFDPDRKYPVLMINYSGPDSKIVINSWQHGQGNLWHQLLCQKGYCILSIDPRGTGLQGNSFKNLLNRDISRGLSDLIEVADQLRHLEYVDPYRLGIWGWSNGAWMVCLAMTKAADRFKTGIAIAPLADFKNYDAIWTERYMDLPSENPDGYAGCSPINFLDLYQKGLLLVHGIADDNVHVQNTLEIAETLNNQNKSFEIMLYPGKDHNLPGRTTRVHLYNLMTDFILKNL